VLEQVTLDVAILGVDGIDAVADATAHHEGEASINRLMAQRAGKVVVAADSSKAGRRALARICAARDVDVSGTDAGISAEDAASLEEAGVEIVIA
jgi:DeoR family transcriptional regulator, aga operon transcriptional repressor